MLSGITLPVQVEIANRGGARAMPLDELLRTKREDILRIAKNSGAYLNHHNTDWCISVPLCRRVVAAPTMIANDMMGAFDFTQNPRSSLVLQQRRCKEAQIYTNPYYDDVGMTQS